MINTLTPFDKAKDKCQMDYYNHKVHKVFTKLRVKYFMTHIAKGKSKKDDHWS